MAEYYRHRGHKAKAEDFYCQAIDHAHTQRYLNDEAIATECAAEYYLSQYKKRYSSDLHHQVKIYVFEMGSRS
ncbi:hypothetical protein [Algoriphagus boritolerans]|uniref:hypothetical protein n=1 Tax=Algoriphagus boritolerans TaxID=308111 RepID=UPI002FCE022E